jgi:hypothetical protein
MAIAHQWLETEALKLPIRAPSASGSASNRQPSKVGPIRTRSDEVKQRATELAGGKVKAMPARRDSKKRAALR